MSTYCNISNLEILAKFIGLESMLLLILKINGNAQHLNRVDNIEVVSLMEASTHQARTDFLVSKRKNEKKMGGKGKRNKSSNLK